MDSRRRRMRPELTRVLAPPARRAPHRPRPPLPRKGAPGRGPLRPDPTGVPPPRPPRPPPRRFLPTPVDPPVAPGLYQDEPKTCRRDLRAFLPILVHLGLLLAVAKV